MISGQGVSVNLPRQQWDLMLVMLARQPFGEVAALIGEIQRQCQMHEMRSRANERHAAPGIDKPANPEVRE